MRLGIQLEATESVAREERREWGRWCAVAEADRLSVVAVIAIVLLTSGGTLGAELPKPPENPDSQSCTTAGRDLCATEAVRCSRDCTLLETCTRACCFKLADCLASKGCAFGYPSCAR